MQTDTDNKALDPNLAYPDKFFDWGHYESRHEYLPRPERRMGRHRMRKWIREQNAAAMTRQARLADQRTRHIPDSVVREIRREWRREYEVDAKIKQALERGRFFGSQCPLSASAINERRKRHRRWNTIFQTSDAPAMTAATTDVQKERRPCRASLRSLSSSLAKAARRLSAWLRAACNK